MIQTAKNIILASASPRRSELLKQIGLEFTIISSNINEKFDYSLCIEDMVQDLAFQKARDVASQLWDNFQPVLREKQETIIIGADTIVVKGDILGKPLDDEDAFRMLSMLQGDWHEVITGIAVIEVPNPSNSGGYKVTRAFERTKVKMKKLSKHEIASYIRTGEPADKAGAYGIQGIGAILVEKIEGCYFNVVGMPLSKLYDILKGIGACKH